jgi:hypothetical protein
MKDQILDLVSRLDPIVADDPVRAVTDTSREEMLTRIMNTPVTDGATAPARKRFPFRRLAPVLVAVGIAGGIAVSVLDLPGGTRQEALSPALSFTTKGESLKVRILDPEADSARFNKEFKAHHLDIQLVLLPSSPSGIGRNVAVGSVGSDPDRQIRYSSDPTGCALAWTYPCVPEFTIPKDYKGSAQLYIGRAPRPGEDLVARGPLDGRGEPLQGVKWRNLRVSLVLEILKQRGYTVPEYVAVEGNEGKFRTSVPANWYAVEGGYLLKGKQVVLTTSPTPK